jgi:hypothetical protein
MSNTDQTPIAARSIPFFGTIQRVGNTFSTTSLNLAVRNCDQGYQIILIAHRIDSCGKETTIELPSPHIAAHRRIRCRSTHDRRGYPRTVR